MIEMGAALKWLGSQQGRYLLVGTWNTVVGYSVFLVLYLVLSDFWHYLLIALVSHFVAVLNAWLCYRHWVFRSRAAPWPEYVRFNASSVLLVLLSIISLATFSGVLGIHPLVAQALAVVLSVVVGYLVHKHYSFGVEGMP